MLKIFIRVLAVAAAVFATTPAAFAASTPCTGTLTGPIAGDVVVPDGATCTLVDVAVTGDVIVRAGASLYVRSTGFASKIRGDVKARDCNVVGLGPGVPYVNPENPYGRVIIGGNVHIRGCTGSPSSGCAGIKTGDPLISPVPATMLVGGDFKCVDNPSGCSIIACTIGGSLQCSGNGIAGCFADTSTIAGDATVNDNPFFQLQVNEVGGDLKCSGNTSGLGIANIVAGTVSGPCNALP